MAKQRKHFWRVRFQRFREERDGSHTPMSEEGVLHFDDKQLYQKSRAKVGDGDARQVGGILLVRKGAVGILDSLLGAMRSASKKGL